MARNKKADDNNYVSLINFNEIEENKEQKNKQRAKRIKEKKIKQKRLEEIDNDMETVINMTNNRQKDEVSKKQKKQTRKTKKKKIIFKFIILLTVIICVIIFALISPLFNIKKITVKNNNQVNEETIVSLSGIKLNDNLFKFSSFKVQNRIKQNAYIEEVRIKREFLNTVQIEVKEREKSFCAEFLNGYAFINNQGYILEISETKDEKIPVLQGITTEENVIKPGNRLNDEDLRKIEIILEIINICKSYDLQDKITGFDISNITNYVIYMEKEKKTIYLGDDNNLNNKILWIPAILEDNIGIEGNIYLNGSKVRFEEKV